MVDYGMQTTDIYKDRFFCYNYINKGEHYEQTVCDQWCDRYDRE